MGLLRKAEKRRKQLLEEMTKNNKKYIDHISTERRRIIHEEIKEQRKDIIKKLKEIKEQRKDIIKKLKTPIVKQVLGIKKKPIKVVAPTKPGKLKVKKILKEKLKAKPIEVVPHAIEIKPEPYAEKFEEIRASEKPKEFKKPEKGFIFTGVPGFDDLFEKGIPKGYSILVAGGAGSGKTIFCLQTLFNFCKQGKKGIYMSFEESEDRLREHMVDFGWPTEKYEKKGLLKIQRINPFDITRSVDALMEKAKGTLLIDIEPVILPQGFKPDIIVLDSLSAVASAFTGKEDSYRIYIEQLFRFFEKIGATSFLITETSQVPTIFSQTGVEEFLADGVIVLYNIKRGNIREKAIEVLKLRGAKHEHKIVAFEVSEKGIVVYPQQEVFSGLEEG